METNYFDAGCFCGNWPFRKLRRSSFDDLLEEHRGNGFTGGLVSDLSSVLYDDPTEGDRDLAARIKGTSYALAMTVNPALQTAACMAAKAGDLYAAAIRLYPCLHPYSLVSPRVRDVCRAAAERNIPVIITARVEDARLSFLMPQKEVLLKDCMALAEQEPDTRLLLSGFYPSELLTWSPSGLPRNVWLDLSGIYKGMFPLPALLTAYPESKLIYSSFFPLLCLQSTFLQLADTDLSPDIRRKLLSENCRELLNGPA